MDIRFRETAYRIYTFKEKVRIITRNSIKGRYPFYQGYSQLETDVLLYSEKRSQLSFYGV